MTDRSEWSGRVGAVWADEWRRTDRSFASLTTRLFDRACASGFARALDIGCGAGEIALLLADARPSAHVTGIDLSERLVAVARERTAHLTNCRIELADAAEWRAGDAERPDLLVSRHGIMFFPDPVTAFGRLRRAAAPRARFVFSCFRERGENRWVGELESALPEVEAAADPSAPGPFAFGDRARVEAVLAGAGWTDVEFEAVDYPMVVGEGRRAVDEALSYFLRIGPAARAMAMLEGARREEALENLRLMLGRHLTGQTVDLPAAAWMVTARAPG